MKKPKRKSISEYLAARIINNQARARFSTLHADYLQEQQMQNETLNEQSGSPRDSRNSGNTTGMTVPSVVPVTIKKIVDHNPGTDAVNVVAPPQDGPRS